MSSLGDGTFRTVRELAQKGQKDHALAVLLSFLRENPNSIPALLWYAALTPDLEKGIQALEHVLRLDPGNARAQAGLEDLRARLSRRRGGGEAAPTEGGPGASWEEATPPPGEATSLPSPVSGDEILQLAGRATWPFRGLHRPIGELLKGGQVRDKDLAWAGWRAHDPGVKWAAGVLLRRKHLEGRQFSPEQMGAVLWPYKGLNRPLGELLRQGLVSLHDLAYALMQGKETLICAAAVLGYPIVRQLLPASVSPALPEVSEGDMPSPSVQAVLPSPALESALPPSPRKSETVEAAKVSPTPAAPAREPLEIVPGSGYLEKEFQAAKEKRKRSAKWMTRLIIIIVLVALVGIALRLFGRLSDSWALGLSLAAIIGLFLLDRLAIPFLRRLKGEEEDFLAGKEGEDLLARLLWEHLDSRWTLFRNVVLPDRQDDIDAVLVGPQGLYALEVKAYQGFYRNVQDRWEYRQRGRWEAFEKNPAGQARSNAARLGKYLSGILGGEVWVEPVVVWAGRGRVEFEHPRVPIWMLRRPDYWLPRLEGGKTLPAETVERIRVALKALCSTLR